jgi:hypothetical protein
MIILGPGVDGNSTLRRRKPVGPNNRRGRTRRDLRTGIADEDDSGNPALADVELFLPDVGLRDAQLPERARHHLHHGRRPTHSPPPRLATSLELGWGGRDKGGCDQGGHYVRSWPAIGTTYPRRFLLPACTIHGACGQNFDGHRAPSPQPPLAVRGVRRSAARSAGTLGLFGARGREGWRTCRTTPCAGRVREQATTEIESLADRSHHMTVGVDQPQRRRQSPPTMGPLHRYPWSARSLQPQARLTLCLGRPFKYPTEQSAL